jgi:hypothetical protein
VSGPDLVGWAATALFATSYFCREPRTLRLTQAAAALVWLAYGIALHATPVIVANVIVASPRALVRSDASRTTPSEPAGLVGRASAPRAFRRTSRRHARATLQDPQQAAASAVEDCGVVL